MLGRFDSPTIYDAEEAFAVMSSQSSALYGFAPKDPKKFELRKSRVLLEHGALSHTVTSGYSVGGPTGDMLCISVPISGTQTLTQGSAALYVSSFMPVIFPMDDFRSELLPGFEGLTLALPRSVIEDEAVLMGYTLPPVVNLGLAHIDNSRLGFFRRVTLQVAHLFGSAPELILDGGSFAKSAQSMLVSALVAGLVQPNRENSADRLYARRAEEYVRANISQKLNLDTLSRAAGCSVRSLQTSFRKAFDLTPREFILRSRLEAARTALLSAGPLDSVTSIASGLGFSHLGVFSIKYHAMYGETPRATLRRGKRL